MFKEFSLPSVFVSPQTKIIRAFNLKPAGLIRKALVLGLAVLNVVLMFAYILGVNNYASTGYEIKALQKEISTFTQENRKLTLEISEKASAANLETELSQSGFVAVKAAKFLTGENQYSQK